MTAPNLIPVATATADYTNGAAALTAGWLETGGNTRIGIATTMAAGLPAGTKHYTATVSGAGTGNLDSPFIPVTPGSVYSAGIYVRAAGGTPNNHRVDIRWYDSTHTALPSPYAVTTGQSTATSTTGWTRTALLNVTAPAAVTGTHTGAAYARVRLVSLNLLTGDVNEVVGFSALQFEAGATLSNEIVPPASTTSTNLFRKQIAISDYSDRTAVLTAGWLEPGNPSQIDTDANSPAATWPVAEMTRHYTMTISVAGNGNVDSPEVPVTAGLPYSVGIYQKWDSVNTARNHRLDIRWYDSTHTILPAPNGTTTGTSTATSTAANPVQTKLQNVVAPTGAAYARLRLALPSGAVGDKIAFSAIQFEQSTTLSANIVDGARSAYLYMRAATEWIRAVSLTEWDLTSGPDPDTVIRTRANQPVNAWDERIQDGNFTGLTTVTTFAALTAALRTANTGVRVDNTINCTGPVYFASGTCLYMGPNGKLIRTFNGGNFLETLNIRGSAAGTYLNSPNPLRPSHDVYIGGPGEISYTTAVGGNCIAIAGDNVVLDGFKSTLWDGGRYVVGVGRGWRTRRVNWNAGVGATSGSGVGGLRWMGGSDFMCIDSYCRSGDDVWQAVPAGNDADPFFDITIDGFTYLGCTGQSYSARLLICGNQVAQGQIRKMTCSIRNGKFIDMKGYSGGAAIAAQNWDSTGEIAYIDYDRCHADGSQSAVVTTQPGQPNALWYNAVMGPIHHITHNDTRIINHHRPGFGLQGATADLHHFSLTGGRLERSRLATRNNDPIIEIPNGHNITMSGTILDRKGNTAPVVQVGTTPHTLDLRYTMVDPAGTGSFVR